MTFDCRRAALVPETILLELHRYFEKQGTPQLQSLIGQNVPPETLADEMGKLLTEWPLLIVFDNFESQLDERREFINEDLRVFLTTLVRATTTGSRLLFTTRYLFDLGGERLGNLQELPLGDLSRAEALMLMQKLPRHSPAGRPRRLPCAGANSVGAACLQITAEHGMAAPSERPSHCILSSHPLQGRSDGATVKANSRRSTDRPRLRSLELGIVFTPKGLRRSAQGCCTRLPWETRDDAQPQRGYGSVPHS